MLALALLSLVLATLPLVLAIVNLTVLATPEPDQAETPPISILIPARNEARVIAAAVNAALASDAAEIEVLVGDDHSTDATADIVRRLAEADPRLRLVPIPPLARGWTGKNFACWTLAQQARSAQLLFIDADVELAPQAAAGLSAHAARSGAAYVSGVPRQLMVSLGERLTVPMIGFLLLGYLPIPAMRARRDASLGAGCGQLVLVDAQAYRDSGGHSAIRDSLHDGVRLPRHLRTSGFDTDLVSGSGLATCRMYRGFADAWAGFSKNAHEGMATPRALPLWTILLFGGQVLPWLVATCGWIAGSAPEAIGVALAAGLASLTTRALITIRAAEPLSTIPLHPATVCVALAIQWNALLRPSRVGAGGWKGRVYRGFEAGPTDGHFEGPSRRNSYPAPSFRGAEGEPGIQSRRRSQNKRARWFWIPGSAAQPRNDERR